MRNTRGKNPHFNLRLGIPVPISFNQQLKYFFLADKLDNLTS